MNRPSCDWNHAPAVKPLAVRVWMDFNICTCVIFVALGQKIAHYIDLVQVARIGFIYFGRRLELSLLICKFIRISNK